MPVDLNLPVPGQSPNWANQLNTEIEKINNALNQGVYYASDYGVIGSGSSDDTNTMQNLIDQVPDGSTIIAPPGAIYRTNGWNVIGRSLKLDLSNAHLVKTSPDNPIFRAEGGFGPISSVSAVSTNQRYSAITVPNVSAFSRGDVVKVFSNDEIRDSRPRNETEKSWQGEFVVIMDIAGSDLRVSPPLIDTYSTNVRVARLEDHQVSFKFGTAEFDHAPTPDFSGSMFEFRAMQSSHLAGHVLRGPGTAFSDRSSAYTTVDLRVENLPPQDGYGVSCSGSSFGEYRIIANRLRHAFTDDPSGRHVIGQTDPVNFGRPTFAKITGRSVSTTRVPWDTHHGGYGFHFYDITATGTDARWLFRIRGRNHTLSNCIAVGAESGFGIMEEADIPGGAETNGHRFVNCATYRVGQPFNVAKFTHVNPEIDSVTIEGGRFEFFRQGPTIEYGSIRMVNPVLVFTDGPYTHEGPAFFNVINGRLTGAFSLDALHLGSGESPSYILRGSSLPTGANQIDVEADLRLSDSARHEVTAVVQWNSTRGEVRSRIWGNHSIAPEWDISEPANRQRSSIMDVNSLTSRATAFRTQDVSNGNEIRVRSGDPVLAIRLNSGTAVTTGPVQPGAFAGQELILYMRGAGSVTIPSGGANNTALGGNVTLQPDFDSLRMVWDTSSGVWVKV